MASTGNLPTLPPVEGADGGFNPNFDAPAEQADGAAFGFGVGHAHPHELADVAPAPMAQLDGAAPEPEPQTTHQDAPDARAHEQVQRVLYSDIGINTLLSRLKASISSARDFSNFLKRRGGMEEEHANSLKKLSRLTLESIHKAEARHESYQRQFEAVMHANERIADNGTQFGLALHAMHENLLQLATKMDASRKTWKQQGLAAEKKVQDAESHAEKAKAKYDQLAEDLDRVKTGDAGAGRKFGLKGPKSAAQHEEDLTRKLQQADQDYQAKVQTAQACRSELLSTTRPQAVTALVDLVKEIDAALTMEMQKYASFTEKLAVNNGQVVSPQGLKGSTAPAAPSMNRLIYDINNDRDFDDFVRAHSSKVPFHTEVHYVKHPTQAALAHAVAHIPQKSPPSISNDRRASLQMAPPQPAPPFSTPPVPDKGQSPLQYHPPSQPEPPQQPSYQSYNTGFQPTQPQPYQSQSKSQSQSQPPPQPGPPQYPNAPVYPPAAQNPYSQPDYARGPAGQSAAQQTGGIAYHSAAVPVNPVFGLTLDDLFRRDGSPVPLVVYQCIQAVDLFGLEVEGIYRIPGTSSHIQAMKQLFDSDAAQVDFRNPEAFQHDVNSVAGLLKLFFRELPDPLLTKTFYVKFIDAARIDDETMRRDSMHALINELPDPNYATLRALMLHLYRVKEASEVNRMSAANLGICWAPSVMGPHTGNNMADAGLQARVVISILDNVLQIFDED